MTTIEHQRHSIDTNAINNFFVQDCLKFKTNISVQITLNYTICVAAMLSDFLVGVDFIAFGPVLECFFAKIMM